MDDLSLPDMWQDEEEEYYPDSDELIIEDPSQTSGSEAPALSAASFDGRESSGSFQVFQGNSELQKLEVDDPDEARNVFEAILRKAVDIRASDVHLTPNDCVAYTVDGDIVKDRSFGTVSDNFMVVLYQAILTHVSQDSFIETLELDTSYQMRGAPYRRFRLNLGKTFDAPMMTLRLVNETVPTPEQLGIPQEMVDWMNLTNGLIMVNGSTGTGKDLPLSTRIPLPGGNSTTMGEIQPGEQVVGGGGQAVEVDWVGPVNRHPLVQTVSFITGESQVAGVQHQWAFVKRLPDGHFLYDKQLTLVNALSFLLLTAGNDRFISVEQVQELISRYGGNLPNPRPTLDYFQVHERDEGLWSFREVAAALIKKYSFDYTGLPFSVGLTGDLDCDCFIPLACPTVTESNCGGRAVKDSSLLVERKRWWLQNEDRSFTCATVDEAETLWRDICSAGLNAYRDGLTVCFDDGVVDGFPLGLKRVKEVGEPFVSLEPTRCISVKGGLYLCGDTNIITHNSTTLASLLKQVQLTQNKKIITVEKPIEFVFGTDGKALITQREVGRDTRSFANGLKSAMRAAPDIIFVGEVRDQEEVDTLLAAAETGHLAVSTIHANSCYESINRIKTMYDGSEQLRVLSSLATKARGFANQQLLKKKNGGGRFAVREILPVREPEVRQMISDGDVEGIRQWMFDRELLMEHQLVQAYLDGKCVLNEARSKAPDPQLFDRILKSGVNR